MPFERLTGILDDLDEEGLEVQSAYVIQIGCIAFSTQEEPKEGGYPVTAREALRDSAPYEETMRKLADSYPSIPKAIKAHPNVFALKTIEKSTKHVAAVSSNIGRLMTGPAFHARLNLPAHQQYLYHLGAGKPIEQFEVVSTGSLFAAYTSISEYGLSVRIGPEYRNIAQAQIEKQTILTCPAIGPSPIHPDFYLICANNIEGRRKYGVRKYPHTDNVLLIMGDQKDVRSTVMNLLYDLQMGIIQFYSVKLSQLEVMEYQQEMFSHFSDLAQSIEKLHSISWWDVVRGTRIADIGRKSLSLVHKRFVSLETMVFLYSRQRSEMITTIKEHDTLSLILDYIADHTEPVVKIQHSLPAALTHFGEEIRMFGSIRSVVVASLVGLMGAIVGAIVGAGLIVLFA